LNAQVYSPALQARVTCPHCWHHFSPEDVLWVSQHPEILGDVRLGAEKPKRFLPTRFTVEGNALDERGFVCDTLACPNCHLTIPRALLELPPWFLSILGAPASGKSNFLAAMTRQLRETLAKQFLIAFNDADPVMNQKLKEYEKLLFGNHKQDQLVRIEKTKLEGDLYDTVIFADQHVSFPQPFIFSLAPLPSHPSYATTAGYARALCLYDNAGEHFLPGQDVARSPVTRHLARSRVLFFLFDPTQDLRFRQACGVKSKDPQMGDQTETSWQETVLAEAVDRVRRYGGLAHGAKHSAPLIVVVTKFDAWSSLLGVCRLDLASVLRRSAMGGISAFDVAAVERMSSKLRSVLWELSPEIVSAAEDFSRQVVYIPVSALGCAPQPDPASKKLSVRPRDIAPMWAEVPLLYAICRWMKGLIPYLKAKPKAAASQSAVAGAAPLRVWKEGGG